MPFNQRPRPEILASLSDLKPVPFWLDDPSSPEPASALTRTIKADLLVIGAGFTGLWTALLAKEGDPPRDVVLIEGGEAASGASGRNGGFMDHCLTHTFENGLQRWPREFKQIVRMGYENLDAIEAAIKRYNIDCDFIRSGEIVVATEPYQVDELRSSPEITAKYNYPVEWIEQDKLRSMVNSPTYLGGLIDRNVAFVNPARLAWGLRRACLEVGVRLFERTQAQSLEEEAGGIMVKTQFGQVRAKKVALATNAFNPLLKRLSYYIVPVYDYVLMTEPLSKSQRDSIGWHGRQGLGDAANQFHYYRTTEDGRILWGGYDAIYFRNNGVGPHLEHNPETWARLADHFFTTFPQLEGLRFTHAWGGAIDTCSRFNVFWGKAMRGKVAYALGYTGLGVGASRFGGQVMLDLLDEKDNERTRLEMVRSKPFPFPPEPFRSPIINLTSWSMAQSDRNNGRRNLWLKMLDTLGLGFDS
ncbi:MAG: FAD-dependent oxidoreductase [Chloroflexi bacterium]|nr:FAD-dependent oxidoreductase [Chloroflexota bacterium]